MAADISPTEEGEPARVRTVTWQDPSVSAGAAPHLSGMQFLQAMQGGTLPPPPIMQLLGIQLLAVEEGRVVFGLEPAEYHYNPIGSVHGGVPATILDSAMGCAVHSLLPAGAGYTTLELKVNLVRPITIAAGPLQCEGKTIHVGGRTATAEGFLRDTRGKLYAHATTTCMIFRSRETSSRPAEI